MSLWFTETFEQNLRVGLRVLRTLYAEQSPYQRVEIFESAIFGRVLALDGLFMTSEGDEFMYHEPLVQVPMCTAPEIKRVLIIGGGDGGSAREVLRHPEVEHVTMVEIDQMVVEASRQHLPALNAGAFDDPRLTLRFEDAIAYVREADVAPFDVIILDGSDPVGPAEGLFNQAFYEGVRRILAPGGVLALQSESPVVFQQVFLELQQTLQSVFPMVRPYFGNVPIYSGTGWSWTLASMNAGFDPLAFNEDRMSRVEVLARMYNRDIHRGLFAVPNYLKVLLGMG